MVIAKNLYVSSKKVFILATFIIYILFLCFSFFYIVPESILKTTENLRPQATPEVHIIGKAAIGQYLWVHLLNGSLNLIDNGFFQNGNKSLNGILFHYLSGPGYIQNTIPYDIQFLVLILNGRTPEHVFKAKQWLDFLPEVRSLKKVAVIILGNERCENRWILPYMKSKGGIIDVLFIVYDSDIVDNKEIFQWPLGVATYRGFPNLSLNQIKHVSSARKYKCNFLGTVYKNSSREIINVTLRNVEFQKLCYISTRSKWLPQETKETLKEYLEVLQNSDFTLNPVGENTECYRIYEALTLGSIPIIEDNMTPGVCVSPLRFLKKFNPPVIFVKNWNSLYKILQRDQALDFKQIIERRKKILIWYDDFKQNIVNYFINILKEYFLK